MCETGESDRYGHRPQDTAAAEFAELVSRHAKRQFEEGRQILGEVKMTLRHFAELHVAPRVNEVLDTDRITMVSANFQGQWEWYIRLLDADSRRVAGLLFGPTAATNNRFVQNPIENPDFRRVFVLVDEREDASEDRLIQTDVSLDEILTGLDPGDTRLADAVLDAIRDL